MLLFVYGLNPKVSEGEEAPAASDVNVTEVQSDLFNFKVVPVAILS